MRTEGNKLWQKFAYKDIFWHKLSDQRTDVVNKRVYKTGTINLTFAFAAGRPELAATEVTLNRIQLCHKLPESTRVT